MSSRASAAGESTQRKYNELTRSWRRRNRRVFAALALICWGLLVASFIAAQRWGSQAWIFGVLGGAAFAFWLIARLSPPGWIENWQTGALGEQATAKALRPLEKDGWIVLHDLSAGRGNIDHVIVGPTGIYLLDSKRLGGTVSVAESGVSVRRLDDPDLTYQHTGAGHLLNLARQTHERILATTRIKTWVTPVMVIWSDFPQRIAEHRCAYVQGEELVAWILSRPQRIAPARVGQVADAVRASWSADGAD